MSVCADSLIVIVVMVAWCWALTGGIMDSSFLPVQPSWGGLESSSHVLLHGDIRL